MNDHYPDGGGNGDKWHYAAIILLGLLVILLFLGSRGGR